MSDAREDIQASIDALRGESAPTESAPAAEAAPAPAPAAEAAPSAGAPTMKEGRDEAGRFTAKAKAPEAAPVAADKAAPPAPVESYKPPQSWKPTTREKWSTLAPDIQAEVHRREQEVAATLQGVAEAKRLYAEFQKMVDPYRPLMSARGQEPMAALSELLRDAASLQTAPPHIKAQMFARMVQGYGVPVDALDAALAGQPVPEQRPQEFRDSRLDYLFAQRRQEQQAQQQATQQQAAGAVEAFAAGAEFLEDVRGEMADLIEVAAKHGRELTLEQAYERATRMHPEISKVLSQREAAKAAQATQAAAQKSKAAASSVRSQPAPAADAESKSNSLRDDVAAAYAAHMGR